MYKYSNEEVENQRLLKIFCRGSSVKESVDFNHKLIVFFVHDRNIYHWVDSTNREEDKKGIKAIERLPKPLKYPKS